MYYKKIKKLSKIIYLNTDNAVYVDANRKEFTFRIPSISIEDKSRLYIRQYSNDYRGSGVESLSVIAGTGTNSDACFVSQPTISFISDTGKNATAIAYMKPTAINGTTGGATATTVITVVTAGAGYCGDPANMITVNNTGTNGTGLVITPTISAGTIASIAVGTAGKGYSALPTYTILPPQATQVVTGTATATSGAVTGVTITNATTNGCYTSTPTLVFNHTQVPAIITFNTNASGVCSGLAVSNPTLNGYYGATTGLTVGIPAGTHIGTVTIGTAGAGYNTAPTITIQNEGGGRDAVITSTVSAAGVVNGLTIVNRGTAYTGTPTLLLSAPDARTAKVYFSTSPIGVITSITVEDGGGYYTAAPTLTIPAIYNGSGSQVAPTMTITMSGGTTGTISSVTWTANSTGTGYLPNLSNAYFTATAPTRTQATATLTIGGSGATANADVVGGRISAVTLLTAGTNYLPSQTGLVATPPALVTPTQPSGGLGATISLGRITAFAAPTTGGAGFINTTTITPSGGTVVPVQAVGGRITLLATSVSYIKLMSSGYGYLSPPIALFEAPPSTFSGTTSVYLDANASPPIITTKLGKEQEGNRMTIKVRNIIYNHLSYYNSDGNGDITIGVGYINGIEMDDGDMPPISIPAQTFDTFTLILTDKYGNGLGNNKVNIAIAIEELDEDDRIFIDMKRQAYTS